MISAREGEPSGGSLHDSIKRSAFLSITGEIFVYKNVYPVTVDIVIYHMR